ncbi:F-box/WD repeat-containing protein 4-like [Tubulanus polymorphus]|uniref:F-box/WD repeat-containing protein 4-like n=1 Tax=Tubulanus polymorphus TaxID=672921 RepID=UPI003DA5C84E
MTLGKEYAGRLNLVTLPELVLLHIFSYCDLKTLADLCQVCQHFNRLANEDRLWRNLYQTLTVADALNPCHETIIDDLSVVVVDGNVDIHDHIPERPSSTRCEKTIKEKCRICFNWNRGRFQEQKLITEYIRQMPHLELENDLIYISSRNELSCRERLSNGRLQRTNMCLYRGHSGDITCFSVCDNNLVSADVKGTIIGWNKATSSLEWKIICESNSEVSAIDCCRDITVAGTRNETVKVLVKNDESVSVRHNIITSDRVWALKINPNGNKIVCGTAGLNGISPLRIWDLESGLLESTIVDQPVNGAGILDVIFDDPVTMYTCGYDTCIKQWDLRSNSNQTVRLWEDPDDVSVYCIKSRTPYSIVSGTARHGLSRLWDKRMTSKPVKMYYPKKIRSPVYALDYTTEYLYLALDKGIHLLDFTGY